MSKRMICIIIGIGLFSFAACNPIRPLNPTSLSVVSSSHIRAENQALIHRTPRSRSATHRALLTRTPRARRFWEKLRVYIALLKKNAFRDWILAVSVPYHTGTVNGYACGGSLPTCCILFRESKGDPYAVNPGHMGAPYGDPGDPWYYASGLFQDMPSTWNYFDGYPYAAAAPATVQYEFNVRLWNNGAGASNWYPAC